MKTEEDLGIVNGYCQVCGEPKEICECQWCRKENENKTKIPLRKRR